MKNQHNLHFLHNRLGQIIAIVIFLMSFSPTNLHAQNDSPCECAKRWDAGDHWNSNGTISGSGTPQGIISCGSSAETQSNIGAAGCVYNSSQFAISLSGCKNPDTESSVSVSPPTNGCPVIWHNFDVRANSGSYEYQLVSNDNYAWALYTSNEHQSGVDASGLSGDCSSLSFFACGNSFSGWATFTVPSFGQPTNLYLAIWDQNCGTQSGFKVTFKARYGCGDSDEVLCIVESGQVSTQCNANGTYTVTIPITGANGNYQGSDPNATPTTSNIVTLTNLGSGGPTSGTITMTYPIGAASYNVQIKDVVAPSGDIVPTNPSFCTINVTGNRPDCCSVANCNDSNACTTDACSNNSCSNTAINCNDSNACTTDGCNAQTGCTHVTINCNDSNACTTDGCNAQTGCTHVTISCDDSNACTTDGCAPQTGCTHVTVSCNDNDACTDDSCDEGLGCQHTTHNCNDNVACTDDDCNSQNGCSNTPNNANCDDGVGCTDDLCDVLNNCSNTPNIAHCDDGIACTDDLCDAQTNCSNTPNNAHCDDGVACTDDLCEALSDCSNTPNNTNCDDGVACTDDICDVQNDCSNTPNNAHCDDGVACTDDLCDAQNDCSNTPNNSHCDDGIACTDDLCDALNDCSYTPDNDKCDDFNPCTDNVCDPGSGCEFPNNTDACNDGIACTVNDICSGGVCAGSPMDCNDGDACTIDACVNGVCQHSPLCIDDELCTDDICRVTGDCLYPAVNCDDDNLCTVEECNPANGNCEYSPTDCSDGFDCSVDACVTHCLHDFSNCDTTNIPRDACPAKIIFVLDESGSIDGFGQGSVGVTTDVRNGSIGLLNALVEAKTRIAIVEFNTVARRAKVNGTTNYQKLDASSVGSFINYINDATNPSTPDSSGFDPEDFTISSQRFTNWEAALLKVKDINDTEGAADLVLFFTDGMPTAYISANGNPLTGTSPAFVQTALAEATVAANSVKLQGSHIFVVGFPNPELPEENVQAISGPSEYPDEQPNFILADYSIEDTTTLANSLSNIGNLICRADLSLAIIPNSASLCPGSTITFTIKVTNDGYADADTVIVKNYIPNGFTYLSDDGGASTSFAGSILTWNAGQIFYTESDSIKVTLLVHASGNLTNSAEITYSSSSDNDSEPSNFSGVPAEDDEAIVSISYSDCADGNSCTTDFCLDGACTHLPINCDDNNSCTVDQCANDICIYSSLNCDDGNACTADGCDQNSGCTHTTLDCNDNSDCTNDGCIPATGCSHNSINCDDENACTDDGCDPQSGCQHTILDCNDNNDCTIDACVISTGCAYSAISCSDNDACTDDACNPQSGCQHSISSCNDNNACTTDGCAPATGCTFTAISCNDNDACTDDVCNPQSGCQHSISNCNDNNACTNDNCDEVLGCQHVAQNCNDNDACTDDDCDNVLGCRHTPHNCNDNNACTDDGCNTETACFHSTRDCNDNKICTTDNCDPVSGCVYSTPNCDDGNACTADGCDDLGDCTHPLIDCNDNDACTDDSCEPASGCQHATLNCDDSDFCTDDSCNPSSGCQYATHNCDDNNGCTLDGCSNGECSHTPKNCDDQNLCTTDACVNDNCIYTPKDCSDSDACSADLCSNGVCSNVFNNCDDNNPSTLDACVNGACVNQSLGCDTIPLKIIFVLDESGSIAGSGTGTSNISAQVRSAVSGILNSLAPTLTEVAFVEFNTNARRAVIGGTTAFQSVNSSLSSFLNYVNDNNTTPGSNNYDPEDYLSVHSTTFTNWEAALQIVQSINASEGVAPLVLYFTDGIPTAYNTTNGVSTGSSTAIKAQALSEAKVAADIVKAQGSHIFVIGIPNPSLPESNIQQISGHKRYPDIETNFTDADYSISTSSSLESDLTNIGSQVCDEESCQSAADCNDGNSCTTDQCNNGNCSNTPVSCNDNNACTTDACNNGQCTSTPLNCNDNNACTNDACNNGQCTNTALNCNDNNICTTDECITGQCAYTAIPNCGCANVNCDDGNSCTTDACNAGQCSYSALNCSDNNACTTDGCNNGQCSNTPINCNDNNSCTIDACSIGQCQNNPDPQCQPCTLEVVSLMLINSSTDQDIRLLKATDTINLFNTPNISVRANLCVEPVGSVRFFLNNSLFRNENSMPYSIAGDAGADYAKWNVSPGLYTLKATPYSGASGGGTTGTAKTIDLLVINQQSNCTSNAQCNDNNACTNDVCSNGNCANTAINCNDNDPCTIDACNNGQCTHTPQSGSPSHLKVVNLAKSWRKLKLGYNSSNLYSPSENVTVGGNTNMCITLKAVGTPEWNKIQIRPQGSTTASVALGSYISGSVANFTTFCIPLSAFTGFNFTNISYIETPYSNGAAAFEIHISKIEFTGGSSPFLWFGDGHTNNIHDGQSGSTSALTATLITGSPCGGAKMSSEGMDEAQINSDNTFISAYPNPFKEQLNFEFSVVEDSPVSIELFSMTGAKIADIFEGNAEGKVTYNKTFTPGLLSKGVYVYRMKTNDSVIINKVIFTK